MATRGVTPMSVPDLTRARELAAALRAELERLVHAAPADAELRAAHELAAQLCPKLEAVAAAPMHEASAGSRSAALSA